MNIASPIGLDGSGRDLLALGQGVVAYGVEATGGRIHLPFSIWFELTSGDACVMCVDCRYVGPLFEVFYPVLRRAMPRRAASATDEPFKGTWGDLVRQLSNGGTPKIIVGQPHERAAPDLRPWPFPKWRVDVLRRVEWLADFELMPEGPAVEQYRSLRPGEVPVGTTQSCLATVGLLFTAATDERLLAAVSNETSMHLLVTENADEIDEYLRPCFVIPTEQYAHTD